MSHDRKSGLTPDSKQLAPKRVGNVIGSALEAARQIYADASEKGSDLVVGGRTAAGNGIARIQKALGEDYEQILATNPLVIESLSRAPLLIGNKELLATVLNVPWMTASLWASATGAVVALHRPVGHALGGLFHYGPGHLKHWADINRYMDSVAGSGHRLKYGHSVDFLPSIVEKFGIGGVPAFMCHDLQDFTTVDGVPWIPGAWEIKKHLVLTGVSPKLAAGLVSVSASNVLAGTMIATTAWKVWKTWERDKHKRELLVAAESAAEHSDFGGAIEGYKQALAIGRSPAILIALGQVYLRRVSTRPYAHRAFTDAVQILGADSGKTIPFHGVQLSLRGIAGLQALSTADVIGDRYPEYWQEKVEDLVNATIHSFVSTAGRLEVNSERRIANSLIRAPLFSAAINRYLAAQVAGQYPFLDNRQEVVTSQTVSAIGLLGQIGQQDEGAFSGSVNQLRDLWARAVLPEKEADLVLATS